MNLGIGELSQRTQVKVPTIRYYEQIGLLAAPSRTEGRQRRYATGDVQRLNFIRHARELGFDVEDIRQLLQLTEKPQESCHLADSIARRHLVEVERRIEQLDALRGELQRMVDECHHGKVCECKIVEIIGDHALCAHGEH
jgi:DNA-binding transcriptional MerR regulator